MRAMKLRVFETRDQGTAQCRSQWRETAKESSRTGLELPFFRGTGLELTFFRGISVERARWSAGLSVQLQMGDTNNQVLLAPRRA